MRTVLALACFNEGVLAAPRLRWRVGQLDMLAAEPEISPSMSRLLAGNWVRMALRDPNGSFDLGGWFTDPLRRTPQRSRAASGSRLWGHHSRWDLEWRGYPFPEDVISAISHPTAGLDGLTVNRTATHNWVLRLDDAELRLHDEER